METYSRRSFIRRTITASTGPLLFRGSEIGAIQKHPKNLAAIVTIYSPRSHARHILDRFFHGYRRKGQVHRPNFKVVALYFDQFESDDLARQLSKKQGFTIYPTIAEALRVGTDTLAVDGVLLIGEHGNYPHNIRGQKLYPRFQFFSQIVQIFRESGRAVPVFNDKHFSVEWSEAKQMVDWSRELKFPLFAGSSLPHTWREPSLEFPLGVQLEEALLAGAGSVESSWFHDLEALQCMVERRKGGEVGVRAVRCIGGDEVWQAMQEQRWSYELQEAAIARSNTSEEHTVENLRMTTRDPHAMSLEYRDGLKATLVHLNDYLPDWNFAARLKSGQVQSCTFRTPADTVNYFDCLVAAIERTFEGRSRDSPS